MTRFARARGSKSSNEKKPEEATSWSEMKNSMINKISKPNESFSKTEVKIDTKKAMEWASLGESSDYSVSLLKGHTIKNNIKSNDVANSNSNEFKKKKKKEKKTENSENEFEKMTSEDFKKKSKNKKQEALVSENTDSQLNESKKKNKKRKFQADLNSGTELPMKMKKHSQDTLNSGVENDLKQSVENLGNKDRKQFHKIKKLMKSKYFKKEDSKGNSSSEFDNRKQYNKKFSKQSKEKKKFKSKTFEKKHSIVDELVINGEKIPIVKFQGFNVTLEDGERLKKLRSEMIKEGIPKPKLEAAIKLERRRAEKALSRLKKSVCFHCRGHGHLLSNCPSLTEKENTSTGICYKCGSTEHSAAECKVIRGTNFQFAECFICKEQGHIARQCPDNPRGLYPQGGACRECGDVTHLRKDCPQVQAQKAEEVITVGVRSDRNLECLDEEIASSVKQNHNRKVKKSSTVKF